MGHASRLFLTPFGEGGATATFIDAQPHVGGGGSASSSTSFTQCEYRRGAVLPKAACPAVGAELALGGGGKGGSQCAVQPPACCEAARRAEAAAKMIKDAIEGNWVLKLLNFTGGIRVSHLWHELVGTSKSEKSVEKGETPENATAGAVAASGGLEVSTQSVSEIGLAAAVGAKVVIDGTLRDYDKGTIRDRTDNEQKGKGTTMKTKIKQTEQQQQLTHGYCSSALGFF